MPKYFKDDARVKAVKATLNPTKPWGKQKEKDRLKAVDKWHEICASWTETHQHMVGTKEHTDFVLRELKAAFNHYRRQLNKREKKAKEEKKV